MKKNMAKKDRFLVCAPLMVAGREFHSFGAQIENALSPYVAVLLLGITRRF